ncbi:MAG: putative LPS assembly protein LptD [Bacteroidota bacterium]
MESGHNPSSDSIVQEKIQSPVQEPENPTDTESQAPTQATLPEEVKESLQPAHPEEAPSLSDNTAQEVDERTPAGAIQSIIQYEAEDSIFFDVKHKTIHLHGAGIIEHDTIRLEAEEVFLDWNSHTIEACSKKNEAGEIEKKVVFNRDGIEYMAESLRYNFDSQRAMASKLFYKQDDGILRANKIKKDTEDIFYGDQAYYTTCNHVKPHFYIAARQLKLKQDDKVVSGPFTFYFDDVPILPLGFVSGIFYFPQKSGFILPKYGGESEKGFCLQDGGYYFRFNDYVDLTLQGDIYSKGFIRFTAQSQYKQRYQYSGGLSYNRNTYVGEELAENNKNWCFKWKHRTENRRTSSLTADVDLQSPSFRSSFSPSRRSLQAKLSSSVQYTNNLVGLPYTLYTSLRHTKDFMEQGIDTATLPSIFLPSEKIYPFRKKGGFGGSWYSDIYLQHKVEFENRLSTRVQHDTLDSDDALSFFSPKDWAQIFKNKQYGVQQTVPLTTNIKLFNYLNLTPTLWWQWRSYGERINYKYQADSKELEEEKEPGFYQVFNYGFDAQLTTTLYGTHFFSRHALVQAIRHQIEPVITFTYTPDFSDSDYYWQKMEDGTKHNRFRDAIYSDYRLRDRARAEVGINLNNRLAMKVKSNEEGGESKKKVPILEGFNWSTSYDFLAEDKDVEDRALKDIRLDAWTSLFDNLFNIRFNSTFDPYIYEKNDSDSMAERTNEFAWNHGQGIGLIKHATLSINTTFGTPGDRYTSSWKEEEEFEEEELDEEQGMEAKQKRMREQPGEYVDFKIPWRLDLNYVWDYSYYPRYEADDITKSLSFNGYLNLTEKWELTFSSAYDITKREFLKSNTDIGIRRDLHCWEMEFSWHPLGAEQRYEFTIGIKSDLLQNVQYNRARDYRVP